MYWYALCSDNQQTLVVNLSVTDTSLCSYNEAIYHIYQTVTSYFRYLVQRSYIGNYKLLIILILLISVCIPHETNMMTNGDRENPN